MKTTAEIAHTAAVCEHVEFSGISSPGAYIEDCNGNLLRVPEEALAQDHTPLMEIVSKTPCMVTRISDDPWLVISKARQLAADADLQVNF
ncbi:MAG: hypothetical protein ACYTFA_10540 [Planctomycetota bacterium]|jgi:hypothetical protein